MVLYIVTAHPDWAAIISFLKNISFIALSGDNVKYRLQYADNKDNQDYRYPHHAFYSAVVAVSDGYVAQTACAYCTCYGAVAYKCDGCD